MSRKRPPCILQPSYKQDSLFTDKKIIHFSNHRSITLTGIRYLLESATPPPARGKGTRIPEHTGTGKLIHLTAMAPVSKTTKTKATFHEADYEIVGTPVAVTFEYGLVNDFLLEWNTKKKELESGAITPNEYFEWKITWPHA